MSGLVLFSCSLCVLDLRAAIEGRGKSSLKMGYYNDKSLFVSNNLVIGKVYQQSIDEPQPVQVRTVSNAFALLKNKTLM